MQTEIKLLTLSGPGLAILLAIIFYALWLYQWKARYLQFIIAAFLLYGLGLGMQILQVPADYGVNALITATIYLSAMMFLCQGVLARHGQSIPYVFQLILSATVLVGIYYFYYVDRNLEARIYILSFGNGLVLLSCFPALGYLRRSKLIDKILYWTLVAFTLNFFVRTPLTLIMPVGTNSNHGFSFTAFWLILQVSLLFFVIFLAVVLIMMVMHDHIDILRQERDEDALTGFLNRRGFFNSLEQIVVEDSARQRFVLVADLDHFKTINDTHGHAVGDEVLRIFANTIRKNLPKDDVMGRIGGEEFAFLLNSPRTAEQALELANRLCSAVADARYTGISPSLNFTASFGLAPFFTPIDHALQRADVLLYQAKSAGRNRVVANLDLPEDFSTSKNCTT